MTSALLALLLGLVQVAPASAEETRVAVYGDVRQGQVVHTRIANTILEDAPDAVFMTGDLVQRNEPQHWAAFEAAVRELRAEIPYFAAVGNHDVEGIFNESAFGDYFNHGRYYQVRIGELAVFVVDSTQSVAPGSAQGEWLAAGLAEAREAGYWLAVSHHHPAYSSGPHGGEPNIVRDLKPVYEREGVNLVLQGHDHMYERGRVNGVTYLVTGGGGAPVYTFPGDQPATTQFRQAIHHWVLLRVHHDTLDIETYDVDRNLIDSATLTRDDHGQLPAPEGSHWALPIGVLVICTALAGLVAFWIR